MTDRELLEAAAKAAGIDMQTKAMFGVDDEPGYYLVADDAAPIWFWWNPLTEDCEALRLAVKLGISILMFPACIGTNWPQNRATLNLIGQDPPYEDISSGQDITAATRRAIVRAAAAIGAGMP